MNGEPLTPAHGFPLRLVVPGYIGARSGKWLAEIAVQRVPSDNYYRTHAYKLFPPQITAESVDWEDGLVLGQTPVNAAICEPVGGAALDAGTIRVRGYAITGGDRRVARVDLSTDEGASWVEAELLDEPQPWSWRLWQADVQLEPGHHTLIVRAVDSAANSQPQSAASIWNFKGYVNNAWHRVTVIVSPRLSSERI